jgi:hypothetical protein
VSATWRRAAAVGVLTVALTSACSGRSPHLDAWIACSRPPGPADIRQFRVRGEETCDHARRLLGYVASAQGGDCNRGCRHEGYTCLEHLVRFTQTLSGASSFTFVDDVCAQGTRRAAWRIVFH